MGEKPKKILDTSLSGAFVCDGKIERELAEIRRRYAYGSHNYDGYEEVERDLARIYSKYEYWSHN
jgi:hypothetical protein